MSIAASAACQQQYPGGGPPGVIGTGPMLDDGSAGVPGGFGRAWYGPGPAGVPGGFGRAWYGPGLASDGFGRAWYGPGVDGTCMVATSTESGKAGSGEPGGGPPGGMVAISGGRHVSASS